MRTILINLDADTGRYRRVADRLTELGLSWERFSAVDGNRLAPVHERFIDRQAPPGVFTPGETGCWISHRLAQEVIANGPDEMGLILEDDVSIGRDLPEVLESIENGAIGKFDVIRLHRLRTRKEYVPCRRLDPKYSVGLMKPFDLGTQAYVVTRRAARHLSDRAPRMAVAADRVLSEPWHSGHDLVILSIDPPVVLHDDEGYSAIRARGGFGCWDVRPGSAAANPRQWLRRKGSRILKESARWRTYFKHLRTVKSGSLSGLPSRDSGG